MTHTVQSKETLYSIAKKYGLTVEQIISLNNLNYKSQYWSEFTSVIANANYT
jgi:LysM repeat protein